MQVDDALLRTLYDRAKASAWSLPPDAFWSVLERSARHAGHEDSSSGATIAKYLESLHLQDLSLACACARGIEAAWDHFVLEFRPQLYAAGRAVAGDSGREIADSLITDLFGVDERGTERRSLFDYYYGRSKLATWLRAVISQRHVDGFRRRNRTEVLDDAGPVVDQRATPPDPDRQRFLGLLQSAMIAALGALETRDRLRLAYYYVEQLTLAQIGRLMQEHESTVSRKLDRVRRGVRQQVEQALRDTHRLNEQQIRRCYDYAVEEWPFDLASSLIR